MSSVAAGRVISLCALLVVGTAQASRSKHLASALPDQIAAQVVRGKLGSVNACYEVERQSGAVGDAKLTVTLDISSSGLVDRVAVAVNGAAPEADTDRLSDCVSDRALTWRFPRFKTGKKQFSYPFVFVDR